MQLNNFFHNMFLKNIKKRNALRNYTITSPIIADYFTLEVILKLLQITIAGMIIYSQNIP